ncbi:hypothetical protein [Flavobacterium franklandianum]|uniref:hypothetical protein n=1 Tax=Flavobacterium franklandianum TaxID=2594430 RepID=UPI00163D966E|nr:hypothetical protein [Flavobacterium franklandianum]
MTVCLTAFLMLSCNEKAKETEITKTATSEEIGQMNKDIAKVLVVKDAQNATRKYD